MEIRTKHLRASFEAGFEAGLEGLKPMEIEAKQYDKEGALFWSSKRKKKQARKNGPPQYCTGGTRVLDAFPAQAVVDRRDHPCGHKNSDKLNVPDDL